MIALLEKPLRRTRRRGGRRPASGRNQKIVEMAHEVIAKTHKDKAAELLFNKAVQFLVEARLKLATNGRREDAGAIHDDAQALFRRDPSSVAAADPAFAVARLAHTNAQLSRTDPRLIQEFAIRPASLPAAFPGMPGPCSSCRRRGRRARRITWTPEP